jgi:hypothetical protein
LKFLNTKDMGYEIPIYQYEKDGVYTSMGIAKLMNSDISSCLTEETFAEKRHLFVLDLVIQSEELSTILKFFVEPLDILKALISSGYA